MRLFLILTITTPWTMGASTLEACTSSQMTTFTSAVKAASKCLGNISYDWNGTLNPTTTQLGEICKCASVDVTTPTCAVTKGPDVVPLSEHFKWVLNQCSKPSAPKYASYPTCTAAATKQFVENLNTASKGCTTSSSFVWDSNADPTTAERAAICECFLSPIDVPKCSWRKPTVYNTSVNEYFQFVYSCEATGGYARPNITEVAAATGPVVSDNTSTSSDICTVLQMGSFTKALKASSNCLAAVTYDWSGTANPTGTESTALCKCGIVNDLPIPTCSVMKGPDEVPLSTHYKWVFTQCKGAATDAGTGTTSKRSSNHVGLIAGIVGGVVVVVLIIGLILWKRKKMAKPMPYEPTNHDHVLPSPATFQPMEMTPPTFSKSGEPRPSRTSTVASTTFGSMQPSGLGSSHATNSSTSSSDTGKWDDPMIMAVRIPYDSIFMGSLISRGGFGEVYRGTYRGETVAIKRLLADRRKDLAQIDDFLGEVKLIASLDHERIVKFYGVAWHSLSDACMVVEFMENGDLRSVLGRWDSGPEQRMYGFDADKAKIALHIAHALVYLHSLQPVVVHRDLKSKNVLLDANFDAKLTDFGISRERADATMTAGVGSSLWMAPEVMMGNRYDEKADIYSFGVVLSELDTHQLPYYHAKVTETGQKLPEAAILQQVMLGRITVTFTDTAHPDLVQLGRECVSLNPSDRPTTAQVLHRVHLVMREFQ